MSALFDAADVAAAAAAFSRIAAREATHLESAHEDT
jgi:hypothetical protein